VKIALFGGAFDPIHYGHMSLAESAYEKFKLDRVIFVPSGKPPHKCPASAHKIHRLEMVKLAIRDNPHFTVSDYELKNQAKAIHTRQLNILNKNIPEMNSFF